MRVLVWLALAACGSSGDPPKPKPAPAPVPASAPKPDAGAAADGPTSLAPTLPGFSIDFGGVVTPDPPAFGETSSTYVSIDMRTITIRVGKGTIGDARTQFEARASIDGSKYTETHVSPQELDYTLGDHAGVVLLVAGILCGGEGDLDRIRAICSTLKKS